MHRYDAGQIKSLVRSLALVYNIQPTDFIVSRESALVMHGIQQQCWDISLLVNPTVFATLTKYYDGRPEEVKLPGNVTMRLGVMVDSVVLNDSCSVLSLHDLLNYYLAVEDIDDKSDDRADETILKIENEMERLSDVASDVAMRFIDTLADEAMCLIVQSELSGVLTKLNKDHTTVIKDAAKRRWSVTFKPAKNMIELFEVDEVDMHGNVDIHQITINKVNRHI